MRIIFYSNSCDFCGKLLEYIERNKLNEYFKMICIDDNLKKIPKNIKQVPTIIDTDIEAPLEGKKAFEYVINQKYFNHPTNNVEFTKNGIPKPTIEEDSKANTSKSGTGFIYVDKDKDNEKDDKHNFDKVFSMKATNYQTGGPTQSQQVPPQNAQLDQMLNQRNIDDKRHQALLRLRGRL